MGEPTEPTQGRPLPRRGGGVRDMAPAIPMRSGYAGRLDMAPIKVATHTLPRNADHAYSSPATSSSARRQSHTSSPSGSLGSSSVLPSRAVTTAIPVSHQTHSRATLAVDPDVWLIALPQSNGGFRSLEGAGRAGAIRVSRPYGHLRSIRPVLPAPQYATGIDQSDTITGGRGRGRGRLSGELTSGSLGSATPTTSSSFLPAERPLPQVIGAVEVETDAGLFRVERKDGVLGHSDMGWALAHLDVGEPDSQVAVSRRQLALLLTLLPTPVDPEHPEQDPSWGWAHKLRGPWERGPLHARGRLGRLIAFDPDDSGKGVHRACFELLGTEEIVWAVGVPCFRTGSVYELVPIGKGLHPSRWLTWPLGKGRRRAGASDSPTWEIARIVYRVGAPRWPLAGVIEPLGPLGVAG